MLWLLLQVQLIVARGIFYTRWCMVILLFLQNRLCWVHIAFVKCCLCYLPKHYSFIRCNNSFNQKNACCASNMFAFLDWLVKIGTKLSTQYGNPSSIWILFRGTTTRQIQNKTFVYVAWRPPSPLRNDSSIWDNFISLRLPPLQNIRKQLNLRQFHKAIPFAKYTQFHKATRFAKYTKTAQFHTIS